MVAFNIKSMVYKQLSPYAKAVGMKLLVLDAATYESYSSQLEKKMTSFGIDISEYRSLRDAIDDYGCVAVLKSKEYLGAPEVAQSFSKVGLREDDIHYLDSTNAKNYPIWGDLDASIPESKRAHLYWFSVGIYANDSLASKVRLA